MTGYAVSARIRQVELRSPAGRDVSTGTPGSSWDVRDPSSDVGLVDLSGRDPLTRLVELWSDLKVAWSQTTFYLFDPEGWR